MPKFDGTGPRGFGPGTGWGMGPCGGVGMGFGRGRGRGFGKFCGFCPFACCPPQTQVSKKEELTILQEEAEILEQDLKTVKSRLTELKDQKDK